jgi:hypothetical protein
MVMEDLQSDEAATVLMINAERTQRQFVVPLFLSPALVLTARRVANGTRPSFNIQIISWI